MFFKQCFISLIRSILIGLTIVNLIVGFEKKERECPKVWLRWSDNKGSDEEKSLGQSLLKIFPNSSEVNKFFLNYLNDKKVNTRHYSTYIKNSAEEFFLINDQCLNDFVQTEGKKIIQNYIRKNLHNVMINYDRIYLQDFKYQMLKTQHVFDPKNVLNFVRNFSLEFCANETKRILSSHQNKSRESSFTDTWGKTPEKCISYEMCHQRITRENEYFDFTTSSTELFVERYLKRVKMTFDEVDDMFFDLITNELEEDANNEEYNFKADKECLVSFIKRDNEMKNLYNIELLSDEKKFKQVLKIIVGSYNQKFVD